MHVVWVVRSQYLRHTPAGLVSNMASYRYRMLIPAGELGKRGVTVSVVALKDDPGDLDAILSRTRGADVFVFGKLYKVEELPPRLFEAVRQRDVRIVVDVCDDYFSNDRYGELRRDMVARADAVSTSSSMLEQHILDVTGRQAVVILDPYEMSRGAPRWSPGERLRALWFGNVRNLSGLERSLDQLGASGMPMQIVVVTNDMPAVRDRLRKAVSGLARGISLELRDWSVEVTARALQECDVVLLPVDRGREFNRFKGPNRVVDSLRAGRFVVTHPMPAYQEFRDWAWVDENIAAGLRWALDNRDAVVGRIARGQEYVAARYSPESVGQAWMSFLQTVRESPPWRPGG